MCIDCRPTHTHTIESWNDIRTKWKVRQTLCESLAHTQVPRNWNSELVSFVHFYGFPHWSVHSSKQTHRIDTMSLKYWIRCSERLCRVNAKTITLCTPSSLCAYLPDSEWWCDALVYAKNIRETIENCTKHETKREQIASRFEAKIDLTSLRSSCE